VTRFIYRIVRNELYSRADTIVLQTERSRNSFPARLQPQISVIPNALMRDEKGRPSDISLAEPTILCLGRLSAQKRFDRAIRAFDAVAERFPEWHLAICGSGDQKDSLEALRVGSRAADRIHLTGPTETPLATLRQAAVFMLPSDYEGFPSALLEAMSQGCACIATDCPTGPRELLAENSGILVPTGDDEQLAGALAAILDSAQKRSELGTAAQRRAAQYLPEQIFPLWLKLLKKRRSATGTSIAHPSITS
jgi:GalNAc-alpha-(1->4)-GalNAc-alpha-(1->3)-diNAcBac-PP-undecaprenol alpha-1,4-N-acetyl-D-galactosaminyltransferase